MNACSHVADTDPADESRDGFITTFGARKGVSRREHNDQASEAQARTHPQRISKIYHCCISPGIYDDISFVPERISYRMNRQGKDYAYHRFHIF